MNFLKKYISPPIPILTPLSLPLIFSSSRRLELVKIPPPSHLLSLPSLSRRSPLQPWPSSASASAPLYSPHPARQLPCAFLQLGSGLRFLAADRAPQARPSSPWRLSHGALLAPARVSPGRTLARPRPWCSRPSGSPAPRIMISEFTGNHSHVVPRRELAPRYRRFPVPLDVRPCSSLFGKMSGPVLVAYWEDRHRCSCRILIV